MNDPNNAAQAAEQPLPSYGKLPFDQLGRDVTEATMGVRQPFDFGPNYPGHAMCLINFNSLARIVDKYRLPVASAPVAGEAVYTLRVKGAIQAWTPTAAAFSIPDGEHQLFLSPAAPQASEAVRNAGIEQAAAWVDKRRHDFDQAHGYMESDTGAWSFGRGDGAIAKEEYSAELAEIAEGLRALKTQADKDDRRRPREASDER